MAGLFLQFVSRSGVAPLESFISVLRNNVARIHYNDMKTLSEIVNALKKAGGFGDGIDTGTEHPIDALTSSPLSDEDRLTSSLALLCRLAGAIDNSSWQSAVKSAIARRTRELLDQGGSVDPVCAAAVDQFFKNEEAFWSEAQNVYKKVVATNT